MELQNIREDFKRMISDLNSKLGVKETLLQEAQTDINDLKVQIDERERKLHQTSAQRTKDEEAISQLNMTIQRLQSEISSINKEKEEHERRKREAEELERQKQAEIERQRLEQERIKQAEFERIEQ